MCLNINVKVITLSCYLKWLTMLLAPTLACFIVVSRIQNALGCFLCLGVCGVNGFISLSRFVYLKITRFWYNCSERSTLNYCEH